MFHKIHNYSTDSDVQAAAGMTTAAAGADVDVGVAVAGPRLRQLRAGNVGRK